MAPISLVAVPDLPPEVQKVLDEFVFAAGQAFSEQLTSIVLFGSAAEGKLRPASDVNLLIILSAFEQGRADHLRQPLRIAESAVQLRPMFLLREEVAVASRVFAPKFADISRRRVILYGEDPFAELSIPRDAEIRQLNRHADILAVRILETLLNSVPAFRPERHQHSLLLPPVIVLERLKYRQIDAQFSFGNLAIDDRGQNVAEICGQLDFDARKALLKLPNPRLVEAGGAATV